MCVQLQHINHMNLNKIVEAAVGFTQTFKNPDGRMISLFYFLSQTLWKSYLVVNPTPS